MHLAISLAFFAHFNFELNLHHQFYVKTEYVTFACLRHLSFINTSLNVFQYLHQNHAITI